MSKSEEDTLALSLIDHLEDKKAVHVVLLDLRGRAAFADFFVVATGTSHTHVTTLAAETDRFFHAHSIPVLGVAGLPEATWALVDAGDIVVHLFQQEARAFYDLEKLWYQPPIKPSPLEEPQRPEKPATTDKPKRADKPDKLHKGSKAGKPDKESKKGKPDKKSKAGKPDKKSKAGKPDKKSKAGKPGKDKHP